MFVDFFSGELWGDFLFECWNVFGFKGFFFKKMGKEPFGKFWDLGFKIRKNE